MIFNNILVRGKSYSSVFRQITEKLLQQHTTNNAEQPSYDSTVQAGFSLGIDSCDRKEKKSFSTKTSSESIVPEKKDTEQLIKHPKRPAGAYACFMQKMFPQYKSSDPGLSVQDIGREVSKAWKAMSDEEKKEYFEKAKLNKNIYADAMKVFNEKLTDEEKLELKEQNKVKKESKQRRKLRAVRRSLSMPKKPRNAYSYYVQTVKRIGDEDIVTFARRCGENWRKMNDAEKKAFVDLAETDHERYFKDIEAWEMQMLRSGNLNVIRSKSRRSTLSVMRKQLANEASRSVTEHNKK